MIAKFLGDVPNNNGGAARWAGVNRRGTRQARRENLGGQPMPLRLREISGHNSFRINFSAGPGSVIKIKMDCHPQECRDVSVFVEGGCH